MPLPVRDGDAGETTHILLVPYPAQGHLNPILQFGKRLAAHGGVRCTVAATRFVVGSTKPSPGSVRVAVFSDGCDGGGPAELGGHEGPYFERLEAAGSETLDELFRSEAALGRPVRVVVYDPNVPWVVPLARRHGAACAAFLTQTCAVDVVYTHARAGRMPLPVRDGDAPLELAGLPASLAPADVPAFLTEAGAEHTALRNMLMNQFDGLDAVDHVLVNSFYDLEPQFAVQLANRATQVTDPEDPENSSDAPQGGNQNGITLTIDPSNVPRALLTVALFTLSMATVTVLYKAPSGVVFGHHRLAYYLSLAAIIVAGVAEAGAALWILGSCQTDRRRFGKGVLWASIVPLVTVMGIGGFAFYRA